MTSNLGILPVHLGNATLIDFTHTLTYYYNLDDIIQEFQNLQSEQRAFKKRIRDFNHFAISRDIDPHMTILNHTFNLIAHKLDNIQVYSTSGGHRPKRGIINGLGRLLKLITGNLDDTDGQRYDEILTRLSTQQTNLKSDLERHFSFSKFMLDHYNSTVETIRHNNRELEQKISKLDLNQGLTAQLNAYQDFVSNLQTLAGLLLDTLQDIENSVSFCSQHTFHPSIIRPEDLLRELRLVAQLYPGRLLRTSPQIVIGNILKSIKTSCKITPLQIIYFLDIPIPTVESYELYHLIPIPSKFDSSYVSVIPRASYVLKSTHSHLVLPLQNECLFTDQHYLCPKSLISNHEIPCEKDILLHGNNKGCTYAEIKISSNYVEVVEDLNQFLVVFPIEDILQIISDSETVFKSLQGIFLLKPETSRICYKNQTLHYPHYTRGRPNILRNLELKLNEQQLSSITVSLRDLTLEEIPLSNLDPIKSIIDNSNVPTRYGMLFLYTALVGSALCYLSFRALKSYKSYVLRLPTTTPESEHIAR